jgi:hypothetical protein
LQNSGSETMGDGTQRWRRASNIATDTLRQRYLNYHHLGIAPMPTASEKLERRWANVHRSVLVEFTCLSA